MVRLRAVLIVARIKADEIPVAEALAAKPVGDRRRASSRNAGWRSMLGRAAPLGGDLYTVPYPLGLGLFLRRPVRYVGELARRLGTLTTGLRAPLSAYPSSPTPTQKTSDTGTETMPNLSPARLESDNKCGVSQMSQVSSMLWVHQNLQPFALILRWLKCFHLVIQTPFHSNPPLPQ